MLSEAMANFPRVVRRMTTYCVFCGFTNSTIPATEPRGLACAAERVIEVGAPGVSRGCDGLADRADGNEGIGSSEIIDDARMKAVALGDHVGLLVFAPSFPPSPYFSCRLS